MCRIMYSVYWIKKISHNDPLTEGYIGVSNNVKRRIQDHKRSNTKVSAALKRDDIEVLELATGCSKEQALLIEEQYRPLENIGWNLAPGGGMPPDRTGIPSKTKGTFWTEEQKSRIAGIKRHNFSAETRKKISDKLKNRVGSQTSRYGTKTPTSTCPHCGKTGGNNTMIQWHFDNCKHKGDVSFLA